MTDGLRLLIKNIVGAARMTSVTLFNLTSNRFMRFLIAGGINTLFGFAVYSVAIIEGLEAWLALLAGTAAGIVFNFITTGGYVFRELSPARFPRFVFSYLLVYAVNLGLIELLTKYLGDKILSQFILIFPMAVFSYVLMARFVFINERSASSSQ